MDAYRTARELAETIPEDASQNYRALANAFRGQDRRATHLTGASPCLEDQLPEEVWKPWPQDDRYEVSDLGRVRSWATPTPGRLRETPRVLSPTCHPYPLLKLAGEKVKRVSYMVLEVFVGPRPGNWVVKHVNRDVEDVRLTNLVWAPNGAYRGRFSAGEVREIRRAAAISSYCELAEVYDVSSTAIGNIVSRRTYAWVD